MAAGVVNRHRAWVEIDHAALSSNLASIRGLIGGQRAVIGVVKANAYGHGAVGVASTLVAAGVERLAVATLSEADELRAAGTRGPILLLWAVGPEDAERLVAANVEPMVTDASEISWLDAAAASSGRRLAVHLKIDTGLGRQGVAPEGAAGLAARIAASSHLHLAGTMTHLATAEDPAYTGVQLQRLADVLDATRRLGIHPGLVHFGATGAILARLPDLADAVRPGLGLYGLVPPWADAPAAGLRPILSLRAHPVRVFDVPAGTPIGYGLRWRAERPSRLATLPIGYGDGWPRVHDNNGFALVRGLRVPMVGAISMDGLVVDVTDAGDVGSDDEVVLIGRQDTAEITVDDVARQRGTINYEVTTALRRRLPRRANDR